MDAWLQETQIKDLIWFAKLVFMTTSNKTLKANAKRVLENCGELCER